MLPPEIDIEHMIRGTTCHSPPPHPVVNPHHDHHLILLQFLKKRVPSFEHTRWLPSPSCWISLFFSSAVNPCALCGNQSSCGRSATSISAGIICLHPFLNELLLWISGLLSGDVKSFAWNLHLAGCAAQFLQFDCFYCRQQLSFTHVNTQLYTGDKKPHKCPVQHTAVLTIC